MTLQALRAAGGGVNPVACRHDRPEALNGETEEQTAAVMTIGRVEHSRNS
jgi:hypothetical protein